MLSISWFYSIYFNHLVIKSFPEFVLTDSVIRFWSSINEKEHKLKRIVFLKINQSLLTGLAELAGKATIGTS